VQPGMRFLCGGASCDAMFSAARADRDGQSFFSASPPPLTSTQALGCTGLWPLRRHRRRAFSGSQERMGADGSCGASRRCNNDGSLLVIDDLCVGASIFADHWFHQDPLRHVSSTRAASLVGSLAPGQRTPVFCMARMEPDSPGIFACRTARTAHGVRSYAARLRGPGARRRPSLLRNTAAAALPRFASEGTRTRAHHRTSTDGGLERELRRRLGDQHCYSGLSRCRRTSDPRVETGSIIDGDKATFPSPWCSLPPSRGLTRTLHAERPCSKTEPELERPSSIPCPLTLSLRATADVADWRSTS